LLIICAAIGMTAPPISPPVLKDALLVLQHASAANRTAPARAQL